MKQLLSKKSFLILLNSVVILIFIMLANHSRLKYVQDEFINDAVHYTNLGYYLANQGVFSEDGVNLSYSREPLSSFFQAIYFKVFTPSQLNEGKEKVLIGRSNLLKANAINLFYFFAICVSMWWLGLILYKSHFLALIAIFSTAMYLAFYANYLITINSEMLAILLLILVIGTFLKYNQTHRWKLGVLSGILMGLLTLTKAVFYYLLPIYIITILLFTFIWKEKSYQKIIQQAIILSLSYSLVILPWMLRNYVQFNDFSIAERGGMVLMIRLVKNQMTDEEYKGGYYAYGPSAFNDLFMGKLLGFSDNDLTYGGKLQRLNRALPEDEIALRNGNIENLVSFYQRANYQVFPEISKKAVDNGIVPEELFKEEAFKIIKGNFIQHLKMSLLFSWRGIWIYKGKHFPVALVNFFLFISVYFVFFQSILTKNRSKLIVSGLLILYIIFHSLLTHYIPRYSVILLPGLSVCLVLFFKSIYIKLFRTNL